MWYVDNMATTTKTKKRTYVTAIDAPKKRRARHITVYGMTPAQVIRLIANAVDDGK